MDRRRRCPATGRPRIGSTSGSGGRRLYHEGRGIIAALGSVWTPQERARVLWDAMHGTPTTVTIMLNPQIEVSVWCGPELVAVIPCTSTAETMQ